MGRWYVIDQVYYYDSETQENKVDVYLDGVSVLKNLTYSPAGKEAGRFTGFAAYRFNMNVNSQASSAIYFDDLEINVMGINEAFQPGQVINSPIPYSYLRMFDFNNSTDGSIEAVSYTHLQGNFNGLRRDNHVRY